MAGDHSVTFWLDGVKAGDDLAIQKLWDRYFQRLVRVAAKRLPGRARRDIDEEDVALSAFHAFCDNAGRGKFPWLSGRDDLWRLLVVITARKVVGIIRQRASQKRGGGNVVGESALLEGPDANGEGLSELLGREPSPELAAQLADDFARLLESLGDRGLRSVALMRFEGRNAGEIAQRMGISPRTVERKLHLIRRLMEEQSQG
jgi:DNA-directed RNA polymerase specialized sigma24 family protein